MDQRTKENVALTIKGIAEIRGRMKWICGTPLSCDINTIGECKASIDATRKILGDDVEILGGTIEDLKRLLGLNEGGCR